MVQYRDLNAPPSRMLADVVADMRASERQSKTGDAGVKDLGEAGDVVWSRPDAPESTVSIRDIDGDLQDARGRIDEAKAESAEALARVGDAEAAVEAVQGDLDALENDLDAVDTRVTGVASEAAKRVSAGPVPPVDAPLGAQWITPGGYLYVRIACEEVPSGV